MSLTTLREKLIKIGAKVALHGRYLTFQLAEVAIPRRFFVEIHVYQHDLPVVGPAYKMSLSQVTKLDTTIVEVVTNTGISGFGETCPIGPTYQPAHAAGARASSTPARFSITGGGIGAELSGNVSEKREVASPRPDHRMSRPFNYASRSRRGPGAHECTLPVSSSSMQSCGRMRSCTLSPSR